MKVYDEIWRRKISTLLWRSALVGQVYIKVTGQLFNLIKFSVTEIVLIQIQHHITEHFFSKSSQLIEVMHICITYLTIIASDSGLLLSQRQAIIWTSALILLIWPLRTNFSEKFNQSSYIFIHENAFKYVVCEKAAILSQPQCVNSCLSHILHHLYS